MERIKNTLIAIVSVIIIVFRFLLDGSDYELFFVSSVTIISFLFVLFCITSNIYNNRVREYENNDYPKIVIRKQKQKLSRLAWFVFGFLITFSILYILFFKSNVINDVIAIITLVISIEDSYIVNELSKYLVRG